MKYIKIILYILNMLISGGEISFQLPNITNTDQIIYINEYKYILVDDENIFEFNALERSLTKVDKRKGNEFIGTYNNKLLFCIIEHFLIYSADEYSTKFTILDSNRKVIKNLKFFETIRPLYMNGQYIYAVTALDFLEQHRYVIDLQTGLLREVNTLPNRINRSVHFDSDMFGNVTVRYTIRDIIKTIIATLKPNLNIKFNTIPIVVPTPAFML
jgi:hypothetical protein